jgi:hypothetical protein
MKIKMRKQNEGENAGEIKDDYIEKLIDQEKKEINELEEAIKEKENRLEKFDKIGETAIYISDLLHMIQEYKKLEYDDIKELIKDFEEEIMEIVENAE